MSLVGARVVAAAREWIDTPYRHQASVKGVGCDCLGLVRGVWREVVGEEPERVPPYSPDWAEVSGEEALLGAARRWLREVAVSEARAGDVLLFRMGLGAVAKHVGIVSGCEAAPVSILRQAQDDGGKPTEAGVPGPCLRGDERGGGGEELRGKSPLDASRRSLRSGGLGACRIIHAYWGRAVCETRLVPWWERRIAGAFRFPDRLGN